MVQLDHGSVQVRRGLGGLDRNLATRLSHVYVEGKLLTWLDVLLEVIVPTLDIIDADIKTPGNLG